MDSLNHTMSLEQCWMNHMTLNCFPLYNKRQEVYVILCNAWVNNYDENLNSTIVTAKLTKPCTPVIILE